MTDYTHCPADVRHALDDYDADVASGAIHFAPDGFADSYTGEDSSDAALAAFVARHVPLDV